MDFEQENNKEKIVENLIVSINNDLDDGQLKEILQEIINEDEKVVLQFSKQIATKIDQISNLDKIGFCLSVLSLKSKLVSFSVVNNIDIEILKNKIDQNNIFRIRDLIIAIIKISEEIALQLVGNLARRIDQTKDMVAIAYCICDIEKVSEKVAYALVDQIDFERNLKMMKGKGDIEHLSNHKGGHYYVRFTE